MNVGAGAHFYIAAVVEGKLCRFLFIRRNTVDKKFSDSVVIADHHAVKTPFLFQNLLH